MEFEYQAGLSPYRLSSYSVKVSRYLAAFTGSGAIDGNYKEVSATHTLPPSTYKKFLRIIKESRFFSIQPHEETVIVTDMPIEIISITANGRKKSIKSTEVMMEKSRSKIFSNLTIAIHTLTGLNQWLASTFDDGQQHVILDKNSKIKKEERQ